MANWVRFHQQICEDEKTGIPRSARFVYMELSIKARAKEGYIVLPQGLTDVRAVQNILPGPAKEVADAVHLLSAGHEPMIRFETLEEKRMLIVVNWRKWNPKKDNSTPRVQEHRRKLKEREEEELRNALPVDTETPGNELETPRARALISSGSSLSPSGEEISTGSEGSTDPWRLANGFVASERDFWTCAYEDAVNAATGRSGEDRWPFPPKMFGTLRKVIETYCVGEDRKDITAWVKRDVGDFVHAVVNVLDEDQKTWSDYTPDGLLRWHQRKRPGLERTSGIRKTVPAAPLEAPTMTVADRTAMADAALAALREGLRK